MRHGLPAPEAHHAGALQSVVREPVRHGRRLFHEEERRAAADAAHEVVRHRDAGGFHAVRGVVVPGDDVHFFCPFAVVEVLAEAHQVCRDGDLRRVFADRVALQAEAFQHAVRLESAVVERDRLELRPAVREEFVGEVRRFHFVEAVESVPPEGGVPAAIQFFDGAVLFLEPAAEGGAAVLAVAVSAELVADVP